MNRQMLADAPLHIQIEWERQREVNACLDRAIQDAAESIAAALRGEKVLLPDRPDDDAPAMEWHTFFIKRGAMLRAQEADA